VALIRVQQSGDARSLPYLKALQTPTGCHPFGLGDCWACLRQSPDLDNALKAVTGRSGGSGSGAGAEETEAESPSE
jgi:hypothetical protein